MIEFTTLCSSHNSNDIVFGTLSQTAPGRPVNLRVTDYSTTSISLIWEAPINSTVQEYLVTYQGMMETITNNNSYSLVRRSLFANIENLIPGDFYVITVQSVIHSAKSTPVEEVQNTSKLKGVSVCLFVCLFYWSSVRNTLGSWWTRLKQKLESG